MLSIIHICYKWAIKLRIIVCLARRFQSSSHYVKRVNTWSHFLIRLQIKSISQVNFGFRYQSWLLPWRNSCILFLLQLLLLNGFLDLFNFLTLFLILIPHKVGIKRSLRLTWVMGLRLLLFFPYFACLSWVAHISRTKFSSYLTRSLFGSFWP